MTPQQQREDGSWEPESQNFGKIHRIGHQPIRDFIDHTLDLRAASKAFREWRRFVHQGEAE
ncbi:MAG: hypothetical protein ACRDMJ_08190 [Solirubrobacteraceae bacterium]